MSASTGPCRGLRGKFAPRAQARPVADRPLQAHKALLSVALGFGALKLLHHDVASVVLHIADALKIDPENHLIGLLMIKANLISATELRRFSIITFSYAVVCLVEGTGLMLEKRWAEYFTVTLTALALPLECFELYKEFTPPRLALLLVNLAVLAYLIWLLRRAALAAD